MVFKKTVADRELRVSAERTRNNIFQYLLCWIKKPLSRFIKTG